MVSSYFLFFFFVRFLVIFLLLALTLIYQVPWPPMVLCGSLLILGFTSKSLRSHFSSTLSSVTPLFLSPSHMNEGTLVAGPPIPLEEQYATLLFRWTPTTLLSLSLLPPLVVFIARTTLLRMLVRYKFKFCSVSFCYSLFCFVLFCFVLFCFVLFCFVLFCFVLFCFVLSYFIFFRGNLESVLN